MRIRVPATSANLGPGFDSMGMALALYNTLTVEESDVLRIPALPGSRMEEHLVYRSMCALWELAGTAPKTIALTQDDRIPMTRGLGSSAACIAGGLLAANAMAGYPLDRAALLDLAAALEGHPDNVLPALLGGITVGVMEAGHVHALRMDPPKGLRCVAMIPAGELSTAESRGVLPPQVSRKDAVYNLSRAALLAGCLATGDLSQLAVATGDAMHQPYRTALIPGWREVEDCARQAGAAAVTISGAGPTMMTWWTGPVPGAVVWSRRLEGIAGDWQALPLDFDTIGAVILE